MNLIKKSCVACLTFLLSSSVFADVVLETATLGATGVTGGWSLDTTQFLGARFQLSEETAIECVGGHLYASGSLFASMVHLDGLADLPDGGPFGEDLIYAARFTPGTPSSDLLMSTDISLPAGTYALIFGSLEFGADGGGAMPYYDQSDTLQADYFFWNGGNWSDNGIWDARFKIANGADCSGAISPDEVVVNNLVTDSVGTPIPALDKWALVLLAIVMAGVAITRLRLF